MEATISEDKRVISNLHEYRQKSEGENQAKMHAMKEEIKTQLLNIEDEKLRSNGFSRRIEGLKAKNDALKIEKDEQEEEAIKIQELMAALFFNKNMSQSTEEYNIHLREDLERRLKMFKSSCEQ